VTRGAGGSAQGPGTGYQRGNAEGGAAHLAELCDRKVLGNDKVHLMVPPLSDENDTITVHGSAKLAPALGRRHETVMVRPPGWNRDGGKVFSGRTTLRNQMMPRLIVATRTGFKIMLEGHLRDLRNPHGEQDRRVHYQ